MHQVKKVKAVLVSSLMKHCAIEDIWGSGGIVPLFSTSVLDGGHIGNKAWHVRPMYGHLQGFPALNGNCTLFLLQFKM
jgi:hypothetical protein